MLPNRAIDADVPLPLGVHLANHGIQPTLQPLPLRIEDRQQDAYGRPVSKARCLIPQALQVAGPEVVVLNQRGVLILYVATTGVVYRRNAIEPREFFSRVDGGCSLPHSSM